MREGRSAHKNRQHRIKNHLQPWPILRQPLPPHQPTRPPIKPPCDQRDNHQIGQKSIGRRRHSRRRLRRLCPQSAQAQKKSKRQPGGSLMVFCRQTIQTPRYSQSGPAPSIRFTPNGPPHRGAGIVPEIFADVRERIHIQSWKSPALVTGARCPIFPFVLCQ